MSFNSNLKLSRADSFISHDNGLPIFLIVLNLNQFYWGHFYINVEKALMCWQCFAAVVCDSPGKAPLPVTEGHCINVI